MKQLIVLFILSLSCSAFGQESETSSLVFQQRLQDTLQKGFGFPNADRVLAATQEMAAETKSYSDKNCVQFIHGVFLKLFPGLLEEDRVFKDRVYINSLGGMGLDQAVRSKTKEVTGVLWALESYGIGRQVARDSVRAGDFVQYWYKRKNGQWGGHVAVVTTLNEDGTLNLYSSNKSTGGPDYLKNYKLRSNAYFVRLVWEK